MSSRSSEEMRDAASDSRGGAFVSGRRPTWAEIDLDALASNFRLVRGLVAPGVQVMAVVKADAYGHGAVECARRLAREGADWYAVALPEEGFELREAGIAQPILCLGGVWAGQAARLLRERIVPVVYHLEMAEAIDRAARDGGVVADVHVKVDTGMGRLGARHDEAAEFARALRRFAHVRVAGMMTHFAAADDPDRDCFTEDQISRFREAVAAFRAAGHEPAHLDMANSAGTFAHPAAAGNMVRPGGVLYGLWRDVLPPGAAETAKLLRPVMNVRSAITLLKRVPKGDTLGYGCTFEASRETLVATLPVGYNDGYVRALSNRGRVVVRGQYAPVVGRVSMDLTLVDVTDVPGAGLGDTVTLLGNDGELSIAAEDMAKTAGTISYEITCGVSKRVPRFYTPAAEQS